MAKKGWKKKEKPVNAIRTSVIPSYIEELVKDAYLEYSLASIVRGIPDYRDGLKPSQRRVLYTMRNQTSLVKSVKIVGEVLGHYHPHGDEAAYATMVRLSQDFKVYVPMVIGHGNFGSLDGDAAAAYRYCCTGDTVVKTITHGNITLDKLADGMSPNSEKEIDIEVKSMDGKVHYADRIFHSGNHQIWKLELANGMELRGTKNHPVMTIANDATEFKWKLLKDITLDDVVVVDSSHVNLNQDDDLKEARFLGAMISEGYVTTQNRIGINNTDKNMVLAVTEYLNKTEDSIKTRQLPSNKTEYSYCGVNSDTENLLLEWNFGRRTGDRALPLWIHNKSQKYICELLKYLFEGDGCVQTVNNSIVYSSISDRLIRDVQMLLLDLKIESYIAKSKRRTEIKLIIAGKLNVQRFFNKIGFVSERKNNKLKEVVSKTKSQKIAYCTAYLAPHRRERFSWNSVSNETGFEAHKHQLEYIVKYKETLERLYSTMRAVKVKDITLTTDVLPVYSIRVCSDCHSFITNGIVSHNTEARISSEAKEIYFNHNWNGVQYQDNFDGTTKEPIFLPSTLPMVLINGIKGVSVGMSSQVPTHNIVETINAYIAYIEGDLTSKNLFKYIKGPDPVIPCTVIRGKGLERAYLNGRGSFFCRMYHHIEEASRGRKNIVFTSTLPFQTKSKIIEDLAAIITDKKANGPLQNMIANISDESNMDSIRIVITLKKEANLQTVLDELLAVKFSQIRVNFTMLVITENNKPQIIGIMDLFKKFYEFQKETSIRSLTVSKDNIMKKLHITEGIALVVKDYDSIINVIRKAKNKEIAKEKILKLYPSLDDIQINSILDTKIISMLNKGSDVMDEIKYLKSEIKNYDLLLSDIDTYLINILKEQKKIFKSYKRRCEIVNETDGKFKLLKG